MLVLHTVVPGTVLGLGGSWAQPSRNMWVLVGFGPVIPSLPVYVGPMGRVKWTIPVCAMHTWLKVDGIRYDGTGVNGTGVYDTHLSHTLFVLRSYACLSLLAVLYSVYQTHMSPFGLARPLGVSTDRPFVNEFWEQLETTAVGSRHHAGFMTHDHDESSHA